MATRESDVLNDAQDQSPAPLVLPCLPPDAATGQTFVPGVWELGEPRSGPGFTGFRLKRVEPPVLPVVDLGPPELALAVPLDEEYETFIIPETAGIEAPFEIEGEVVCRDGTVIDVNQVPGLDYKLCMQPNGQKAVCFTSLHSVSDQPPSIVAGATMNLRINHSGAVAAA